jgi:Tfp pilus assembly protein PilX
MSINTIKSQNPCHDEHGAVLITCLVFICIFAVLSTSAYLTSSSELKIGSNYTAARQAFYDADAGVNYAKARIEYDLANGTLTLTGGDETVSYAAPAGFSFDTITTLTKQTGTNNYSFQSAGHSGNAQSTIEVFLVRDSLFDSGIFGDIAVDMKSSAYVYSYDSRTTLNATPGDSTGEASLASNGTVIAHNDTHIDGGVGLGDDGAGTEAVLTQTGTPDIQGYVTDVDRVNPDPLGAIGGDLAGDFGTYSSSNDNASAVPSISGTTIDTNSTITLKGKSGGSNFYLTSIILKNGAVLEVDATAGPVNIYLHGSLEAKNGSTINLTGVPPDFTVYCDTTDSMIFKHSSVYKGTVYAPYAHIEMKNSSDVYGMLWGRTIDIKNSGEFYMDMALLDKWLDNTVSIVSWREIRG